MDLTHNTAFKIFSGDDAGIYRVILDENQIDKTVVVRLDPPSSNKKSRGGRKRLEKTKQPRKKEREPQVGNLIWMERSWLKSLKPGEDILEIEIEQENYILSEADEAIYAFRKKHMVRFFNFTHLRESILIHRGMGGLVAEVLASGAGKTFAYNCISLLCRFGFLEESLKPTRSLNCGAPGTPRPCDPGGRNKAGRKTEKQRIDRNFGKVTAPEQPGISSAWQNRILAADKRIPTPKPLMPQRCTEIINSAFVTKHILVDGKLVAADLKLGDYPNKRQVQRVLEDSIPWLQRLLERTTKGHFKRSLRGLIASSWKGVVGPGHTWAIDSTIGDIYLRSSINRAWIIGRPVVYIVVDVWSTAIVGFYVCLDGPSWDMAKLALFSSAAPPDLLAELWGYESTLSLYPNPTMCASLLCDRGEYLSKAASITGAQLIPDLSYAPPYRPDLKGIVEVLHRIKKDHQYFFIPGAIDNRREEFELRKFNPSESVMTLPEYVTYLHTAFTEYNLTANRRKRLDVLMLAAGVFPSPAGLWRYGHEVGVGVQRNIPLNKLIKELLPTETAQVTRQGVMFGGMKYESEVINDLQWTTRARNGSSWGIPASHFPGTVSRIWTPNPGSTGLLDLRLSDNSTASPELTWHEVLDVFAVGKCNNARIQHESILILLGARQKTIELVERAKRLTAEAEGKYRGVKPTLTEARAMEGISATIQGNETSPQIAVEDPARIAHRDMMKALFAATNAEVSANE